MADVIPAPTGEPPAGTPPANPSGDQAPATGERPSWVPETAWDAEAKTVKLDELGTAFASANKDTDVPATVDAYAPPAIEGLEADAIKENPAFKAFAKQAHLAGLGQEKFAGFVKDWIEEAIAAETTNVTKVKEALGANADTRLQTLSNGLAGKLTAEEHAAIRANMNDPLVITALEKLAQGGGSGPAPRVLDTPAPTKSEAEIKALMLTSAYTGTGGDRDPKVVAEVDAWFKAKYPPQA